MNHPILAKLESSRRELLDLGLRNPLLNHRLSKAKGVKVVMEKSESIFDILVTQGKNMSFLPNKNNKDESELDLELPELPELSDDDLQASYIDTKLQTLESEITLQKRLLNTYYDSRLILEEQGINTLYLAIGSLTWYESDSSEDGHYAPLLLIPVKLERSSAGERFKLSYTGADIEFNLSLQAKLKVDFGITIPTFKDNEQDINSYFNEIQNAISAFKKWGVEPDAIVLGFFSFGKFMLYNDLDSNNWPENDLPQYHPLLNALLESGFSEQELSIEENSFIDNQKAVNELFQVMDADSSQVLAIQAVDEGRNIIIQGPPGTGKSQTIANIIANAIGKGKKVLFVAEKMAALEVVKRRLDNINLGEACLELHSHKANKKDLHSELRRILELGKPNIRQLEQEVLLLDEYRVQLNNYCSEINSEISSSGLSLNKIFGLQLSLEENIKGLELPPFQIPNLNNWNLEKINRVKAFSERIMSKLKDIGIPSELKFWGSALKILLPNQQEKISNLLTNAYSTLEKLEEMLLQASSQLQYNEIKDIKDVEQLEKLLTVASNSPELKDITINSKEWNDNETLINEIIETGRKITDLKKNYDVTLTDDIWTTKLNVIREEIALNGRKWWKFLIASYKNADKTLRTYFKQSYPKDVESKLKIIDDVNNYQKLYADIDNNNALMQSCFQKQWCELKSQWDLLQRAASYLADVHKATKKGEYPLIILDYLAKNKPPQEAQSLKEKISKYILEYKASLNNLLEAIDYPDSLIASSFENQKNRLGEWREHLPELHQVVAWNNLIENAKEEGLNSLIEIAEKWPLAKDHLKNLVLRNWYDSLISNAFTNLQSIRKFESTTHQNLAENYRKLDVINQFYHRGKIALEHHNGIPKLNAGGQMNVLRTEFNKKAKHLPIRKLIQEAGLAIQAIKPVFMMSPISIANFLPPNSIKFDLVVFDEASQVRPVDALGAILRGKQLVVVGDSKQMPPTSFFDSSSNESDDEENVTADLQSILGLCDAQGAPQRMLRWHYRSKHESLISVSNHEFYENKLVIFPSPGSKTRLGLVYHLLKDTYYDRGKTRSNPLEAQAVAEAIMQHARSNPKQSLGVVAFSTAQKQAIQDALEIKRRLHPELENFFNPKGAEPFFVKNLENVQGDERDVIFISIGYGRTQEGYVPMSFGPINNEGGERRLNVLITRAKLRCEVFTNLTSDDIDLTRSQKYGVKSLKSFLQFAQKGVLDLPEETGNEADSPFEEMVANKLRSNGYNVKNQVGSKGFYIDLAVVDPENPGRYLLGIECDGAAYHSAKSARDRDRLRQQILEGMGWKFHRVWSTDWFRNSERELQKIIHAIEDAKNQTQLEDEALEEAELLAKAELLRDTPQIQNAIAQYQIAIPSLDIAKQEIHLHPVGQMAGWIEEIVKVESPVHFDEMAKRIAGGAGVSKVGSRIKDTLLRAVVFAETNGKIRRDGLFLWHHTMATPILRNREMLPAGSKKICFIAPQEIQIAILDIITNSIAIENDAVIPLTAKMLGFIRVTDEIKTSIQVVIDSLLQRGDVIIENTWLKINNSKN